MSWRELARLTAYERDPQKFLELAQQLIRALDAESNKRMVANRENEKCAAQACAAEQEHSCS